MRKFGKTNGSKVGTQPKIKINGRSLYVSSKASNNSAPGFFEGRVAPPKPRTSAQGELSQPRAMPSAEDIKILEEEAKEPLKDISELISSITSMHQ